MLPVKQNANNTSDQFLPCKHFWISHACFWQGSCFRGIRPVLGSDLVLTEIYTTVIDCVWYSTYAVGAVDTTHLVRLQGYEAQVCEQETGFHTLVVNRGRSLLIISLSCWFFVCGRVLFFGGDVRKIILILSHLSWNEQRTSSPPALVCCITRVQHQPRWKHLSSSSPSSLP